MSTHSGVMQMLNSITVAGAVLALPEFNQSAPASRLTSKEKSKQAPEASGAEVTEMASGCQVCVAARREDNKLSSNLYAG